MECLSDEVIERHINLLIGLRIDVLIGLMDLLIDWLMYWWIDDKLMDGEMDWSNDTLIEWLIVKVMCWSGDRVSEWLSNWSGGWIEIHWSTDWLIKL